MISPAGEIAAWAYVREERPGDAYSDDYLRPGADPALQHWMLETIRERAMERAAEAGLPAYELSTGCYVQDTARAAALAAAGWSVVRQFHRMVLDLPAEVATPEPVPGIDVRVAGVDEAGRHDMHAVMQAAFTEHWDFHPEDYDEWWRRQAERAGFDGEQWWVAYDGSTPAAGAICSDRMAEMGIGYIAGLGTVPAYRGRGLGRLLLRHAFADFARRGRKRAQLGVDTQNTTGALGVYESVGMHAAQSVNVWAATVPVG